MLDHVGDEHRRAIQPHARQQLIEELPRWPDERPTLAILVEAWPLTDEQHLCLGASFTWHTVLRPLAQVALLANTHLRRDCVQNLLRCRHRAPSCVRLVRFIATPPLRAESRPRCSGAAFMIAHWRANTTAGDGS